MGLVCAAAANPAGTQQAHVIVIMTFDSEVRSRVTKWAVPLQSGEAILGQSSEIQVQGVCEPYTQSTPVLS